MLDNSMGWTNASGKLVMTTIGTSDSAIPENAKWKINSNSNGYCFVSMASSQGHAVTSPTSSGGDLTVNSYSASAKQSWTISPITASYHGVTIKNSVDSLVIDDSSTFTAVIYSTYNTFNGGNVTWSVSNGTGSATVNSSTGSVTGVSQGIVTVTATYKYSYSTSWTASKTLTIIPLADGTYYFTNIEHDKVLQSTSNDTKFKVSEVDGETDQRWRLELVGNFEYKIISLVNNKAVTAPTSLNDDLTLTDYTAASNQRWLITVLGNAQNRQYKLSPASSTANYMATGDTLISSAPNVELRANMSDNKDEWELIRMLPTNGYELDYTPSYWESDYILNCCNCYGYILNNQVYPGTNSIWFMQQMGHLKIADLKNDYNNEDDIFRYAKMDVNEYNTRFSTDLKFERIEKYDICPTGTYKVALVYSQTLGYHWYRQDSDGL